MEAALRRLPRPARAAAPDEDCRPFSDEDYRAHVDGRPRLEGIRAFLASRGISLPEGTPDDPPGAETVAALGKRKNALYLELLDRLGVEVDDAAVALVRGLRAAGVRVGVATSSRNASVLLQRAGLESLFEAQVDGVVGAELGLRGKPHPDAVLECLRRLGPIAPERAVLVEDAASGVEAGRAAGFGLVLGVDRGENWVRLREAGADWVVRSLAEVTVGDLVRYLEAREHVRPNALREWPAIARELRGRRLAVFLDYDGTLTPIVERPELAVLDLGMRRTVIRVTSAWPTYVISGRGLDDVRALLGIDSLWMAGSHGFDLGPPRGESGRRQVAPQLEPEIHAAADELRRRTASISGVLVEDKRFSLAVHYRLVAEADGRCGRARRRRGGGEASRAAKDPRQEGLPAAARDGLAQGEGAPLAPRRDRTSGRPSPSTSATTTRTRTRSPFSGAAAWGSW